MNFIQSTIKKYAWFIIVSFFLIIVAYQMVQTIRYAGIAPMFLKKLQDMLHVKLIIDQSRILFCK